MNKDACRHSVCLGHRVAALASQEAMTQRNTAVPVNRRLQFRMGINLGEISPTWNPSTKAV
jgi:class 3 adenylate cyclase